MLHVDEGTLHALLDGALRAMDPARADAVEAHLEACAECRALADQAARVRGEAGGILALLEPEAVPDFQEVLVRAGAMVTGGGAPSGGAAGADAAARGRLFRQARWTRGLAWAATLVIALGTGYLIRDRLGPERAAEGARFESEEPAGSAPAPEPEQSPENRAADVPAPVVPPQANEGVMAGSDAAGSAIGLAEEAVPVPPPPPPIVQRSVVSALGDAAGYTPAAVVSSLPQAPVGFRAVDAAEAGAAAGTPVAVVPGAELLAVFVGEDDGTPVVSRQRLETGVEVRITQQVSRIALDEITVTGLAQQPETEARRAALRREVAASAARAAAQAPAPAPVAAAAADVANAADAEPAMRSVRTAGPIGWELIVEGPLSVAELEALAAAAREAWVRATLR